MVNTELISLNYFENNLKKLENAYNSKKLKRK